MIVSDYTINKITVLAHEWLTLYRKKYKNRINDMKTCEAKIWMFLGGVII